MSNAAGTDCVKVAVRVRPFVPREIDRGCVPILGKTPGIPQLEVVGGSNSKGPELYTFNNVFMQKDSQEKLYVECVQPMIGSLFDGYNVTILAYGYTQFSWSFKIFKKLFLVKLEVVKLIRWEQFSTESGTKKRLASFLVLSVKYLSVRKVT